MSNNFLWKFLLQVIVISSVYFLLICSKVFALPLKPAIINMLSLTIIFLISGLILFLSLKKGEPIASRFLIMTSVQMLSFLSVETAFIYTNQPDELVYHGLLLFFFQFIAQTFFLIRIQKK